MVNRLTSMVLPFVTLRNKIPPACLTLPPSGLRVTLPGHREGANRRPLSQTDGLLTATHRNLGGEVPSPADAVNQSFIRQDAKRALYRGRR
jgi:hypothetical protein